MRALLACLAALAATAVAGCAGDDRETLTVYLPARLGPEGPPGQIAPVLSPVERERRDGMPAAWQSVLELRAGPAPDERARGVREGLDPATRLRNVTVRDGIATVELAGKEPALMASAAVVYSLTELAGVQSVRLRLDGRPCCLYGHDGLSIPSSERDALGGWSGEPCALRTGDEVRCRG